MPSDEETPPPTLVEQTDEKRIPHLVTLNGPEVGAAFRLSQPRTLIGASSQADVQLTPSGSMTAGRGTAPSSALNEYASRRSCPMGRTSV
jgi:hypothetical protein